MRILYSPQLSSDRISYEFGADKITATLRSVTDVFDFSGFGDGVIEDPLSDIATTLDVNPIVSVERKNGVLSVVLLNYISEDATEAECFPTWMEVV